jgi:hypothetical protein
MPVELPAAAFEKIVRLALAIRVDGEFRIDINEERLRVQACSEDKIAYLDYSLSTDSAVLSTDGVIDTCWIHRPDIAKIIRAGTSDDVTICFPSETPNSTITLRSGGFTYRYSLLSKQLAHRVYNRLSTKTDSKFSLKNQVIDRAVTVADLIGSELHVQFNPTEESVKFTADGDKCPDSFNYSHPVRRTASGDNAVVSLLVSTDRLQDVTPLVPATMPVSVSLSPNYLTYRTEGPVKGGELTIYAAKRHGKIG